MYKIYTEGNYFVIVSPKKERFYGQKKDVFVDKSNTGKAIYKFSNIKDFSDTLSIKLNEITKENGTPYTETEFDNFYKENTGSYYSADIEGINGQPSTLNTTTTVLDPQEIFVGDGELNSYADAMVTVKTDKKGTLYCEFTPDGTNWDSSISFPYDPELINPPQVLVKGNRYFRVRFQNTDTEAQTFFRLNTYYGHFDKLTNSLNSTVPQTFGSVVTRPIDFNLMVSKRLYQGHEATLKDGINLDIDTGSTPQDIWSNGGVYTGFPLTAENGQIVVAGADTGTVFYSYLESEDSTEYGFGSVAVTGAGTYPTGHPIYRSNYALFVGTGSSFNAGDITVRQITTTTNIFCTIKAGQGQTFCGAYTVPKGHTAYFDRITGAIRGGNTGASADMFFWWRRDGQSPLLRVPFVLNFGSLYFDDVDYLIDIPEGTDIIPRCTFTTGNNAIVHVSYRIIKVKN